MHGLHPETDFTKLVGQHLEQVCVGFYELILRFTGDCMINLSSEFELLVGGRSWDGKYPLAANAFASLLGGAVKSVIVRDASCLAIQFDDGATLLLYDREKHYESFHVRLGDRVVAV